jgi:small subunit ribosomal protein S6
MAVARDYELGIIVNPDVGDEQTRAIVDRITHTIAANDGQVVRVNAQGRRRLAYPIEHHRDGMYFYFDMVLPPQAVTELERTLRVNEDVIRHLVLVRDPRAVAQQRQRDAEADAQAAAAQAAQAAQAARPAAAEPAPEVEPMLAEEVAQPAAEEPAAEQDEAASEGAESDESDEGAEAETTETEAEANA